MSENKKEINTIKLLHAIKNIPKNCITFGEKSFLHIILSCINIDNKTWHSVESISEFACASESSAKRYLKNLEQKKFIFIDRPLHYARYSTNHYSINIDLIMSFSVDKSGFNLTTDKNIGVQSDTRVDEIGVQIDLDRGSDWPTKKKREEKKEERASARKKRVPLSDYFLPNEKINSFLNEVSSKVNKSPDQLLTKFKNLQKSKQNLSADWNAELENFLINEKPLGFVSFPGNKTNGHAGEIRSTVLDIHDPDHPSYELFMKNKKQREEQEKQKEKEKMILKNTSDTPSEGYLKFKEYVRMRKQQRQGDKSNGKDNDRYSAGNSSRSTTGE